jgi:multidrug efflux pump subunit AcrA (membrane-fusion protein)
MAVTRVVMPKLSEQMETGKIIKWLKQEGDRIQSGDILARSRPTRPTSRWRPSAAAS